jgi:ferrochelatase
MVNSIALQHALQEKLGGGYCVALGMRYNHPSIPEAIAVLQNQRCETIIVLPLFPQFADATTQSALTIVQAIFKKADPQSSVHIIPDFYNSDYYIKSCAHMIQNAINNNPADYILFSYHGLPARQLAKKNCAKQCQLKNPCPIDHQKKTNCYRAQCYATTDLIAQSLGLHTENYQTVFQSRLGFSKWIGPYTDHTLHHLRKKNITALSVVCPSFVADCVETLEEINMRLRAQWLALGGKSFSTIPCLNADRHWVNALGDWLSGIG